MPPDWWMRRYLRMTRESGARGDAGKQCAFRLHECDGCGCGCHVIGYKPDMTPQQRHEHKRRLGANQDGAVEQEPLLTSKESLTHDKV